ncbi:MAG: IgGFc-binding protein, partial [Bacteroidota bacterium]
MNPRKLLIEIIIIIIAFSSNLQSQPIDLSNISSQLGTTHAGKDFWFTFHPNYSGQGAGVYIFVTSKVATPVTLEVPGKFMQQKSTIPYKTIYFVMPFTSAQPFNTPNNQAPPYEQVYYGAGIHVYSDDEIVVYCASTTNGSADGFTAFPVSVLGRDYIVSSWADTFDNTTLFMPSFTSIVGVFDQTRVYVSIGGSLSTKTVGGMKQGSINNWTLYKGDVLIIPSAGKDADLSGTIITSTKPVAVISGNRCANVPSTEQGCDYLIEQEIPTYAWGKSYYVSPIYTRAKNSYIKIFSKDAENTIYRDGSMIASLKTKGGIETEGWLTMRADQGKPRPVVISGDRPISVSQFNPSRGDDNTGIDPFQINLVSKEQFQKEFYFTPPKVEGGIGFNLNYINIIYQPTKEGLIPDELEIGIYENQNLNWYK